MVLAVTDDATMQTIWRAGAERAKRLAANDSHMRMIESLLPKLVAIAEQQTSDLLASERSA